MDKKIILKKSLEIKSDFLEEVLEPVVVMVLTKNYDITDIAYNPSLKKGARCILVECGLYEWVFDFKTKTSTPVLNGTEWCSVEIAGADEEDNIAAVRVKDLREMEDSDMGLP